VIHNKKYTSISVVIRTNIHLAGVDKQNPPYELRPYKTAFLMLELLSFKQKLKQKV